MSLVFASICPHPPIIIPTIGRENLPLVKKTVKAMEKLAEEFVLAQPETVVIISPHSQMFSDAFSLNFSHRYEGHFRQFGDLVTKFEFNPDLELIHFIKEAMEHKIPLILHSEEELDHGVLVPLFYLTQKIKPNIVPISYSFLDSATHLKFGQIIKEEISVSKKRIAVVASGDLSHCLTPEAPGGYSPQGKIFDQKLIKLLKKREIKGILKMDQKFIEKAGECGLRSFLILLGLLEEIEVQPELYSYEGPFGVGYLVMNFKIS